MDDAGFSGTRIVAKDGDEGICDDLSKDPVYANSIDIVGLHYPSDYKNYDLCHSLNKPLWASEESSSYDDLNGAACWARVMNSHFVLSGITSSIMWNLVGAYYHGTNWYASSMLTSVEPWSGHYEAMEVLWTTAHVTQFTQIGWKYLQNGYGSGELPQGGFYTTLVDPNGTDFTLQVVKISWDHAPCTRPGIPYYDTSAELVNFTLSSSIGPFTSLAVWRSNYEAQPAIIFERQADIQVRDGTFSLYVKVGDFYTISTIKTARRGSFAAPPPSQPSFPLPYADDFESYAESQEAAYFADQIGSFEIHRSLTDLSRKVMRQMVPEAPISWVPSLNGPMSVIGMSEWQDVSLQVDFSLFDAQSAACLGSRVNQNWDQGIVLCINSFGEWNLTVGGPNLKTGASIERIASGQTKAPGVRQWNTLSLSVVGGTANGALDRDPFMINTVIRNIDTGFACIGTNQWSPTEFDNFKVEAIGPNWIPKSPCGPAIIGTTVGVRSCQPNGVAAADQSFRLLSNWQIQHIPSNLCVTAAAAKSGKALRGSSVRRRVGSVLRLVRASS